jgi:hypothetical protein
MVDNRWYIDWVRAAGLPLPSTTPDHLQVTSKPILAFIGCLTTFMGFASGMGLLTFIGVEFNDIVYIMPFLCIGR